jgi:DNA-directed RNA polymerase specialized sigma24 family protein
MTEHEANADEQSPLTLLQRILLGVAMWPTLIAVGVGIPAPFLDPDTTLGKAGFIISMMLSLAAGKRLWRLLSKGAFRAGIVFGAFGTLSVLGIGAMVATAGLVAILSDGSADQLNDASESVALLESEVAETAEATSSSANLAALGLPSPTDSFATCIEELHRQRDEGSMRDEAWGILVREVGPELADEAVHDVMIAVCEKFGEGKVRELRSYFFKSVYFARSDLRNKKTMWKFCELEEKHIPRCKPDYQGAEQLRLVRAAMCRIDSRQVYILRQRLDGVSHKDIASKLGISAANSRKILDRARDDLEEEVKNLSRCSPF